MSSPFINSCSGSATACLVVLLLTGCAGPGAPARFWPDSALEHYERAVAAADAGRSQEARRAFEELAEAHPEFSGPRRQLARLALERGDAGSAMKELRAARSVCDDCAAVLTELGLAQRARGDFEAARVALEEALATDSAFAPAHYDLAVLHELYLGRPGDAIRHYERYLELGGEADEGDRIRAWIARLEREAATRSAARLAADATGRSVAGGAP